MIGAREVRGAALPGGGGGGQAAEVPPRGSSQEARRCRPLFFSDLSEAPFRPYRHRSLYFITQLSEFFKLCNSRRKQPMFPCSFQKCSSMACRSAMRHLRLWGLIRFRRGVVFRLVVFPRGAAEWPIRFCRRRRGRGLLAIFKTVFEQFPRCAELNTFDLNPEQVTFAWDCLVISSGLRNAHPLLQTHF